MIKGKAINKIFLLLGVGLVLLQYDASAEVRKYSNEFLAIGISARGLGMSNSQVATVDDVTAGYWNPAGLLHIKTNLESGFQIAAMHSEYFAGIAKYDYAAIAVPLKDRKSVGALSIIRFGIDDIPNTLQLIEPDGTINYDNIESFSAADYAFIGSYSREIWSEYNRALQFGASVKVIHRTVGSFGTAWGFGLDAGVQYQKEGLRIGVAGRDITGTYNAWTTSFSTDEKEILLLTGNELPGNSMEVTLPRVIAGVAYKYDFNEKVSLLGEMDLDIFTDGKRNVLISAKPVSIDPHLGLEFGYSDFVFVRTGLGNIQKATDDVDGKKITTFQPNVGLGIKIKTISIDYAFTDIGNQSQALYSHVFSLKLDIKKRNRI